MRLSEFKILQEMASSKLFHYTRATAALDILQNQEFQLTSALGNGTEMELNKNYPYYMSTSRNKVNDYVRPVYRTGVMFNLNGSWFNRNHKVAPVDYWNRSWLSTHGQGLPDIRTSEQEDRVLSQEPRISFKGRAKQAIDSIHLYIKPVEKPDSQYKTLVSNARKIVILAKKLGIRTYFYTNERDFILQHPLKIKKPELKQKAEQKKPYYSNYGTKYLKPWIELYYKHKKENLSPEASKMLYNITTGYISPTDDFDLSNVINTYRKPGVGKDTGRELVVKLTAIMRKERLQDPKEYVRAMRKKWRSILGYE